MSEDSSIPQRKLPNVLITGTPGTGKTTTAQMIADVTGFNHIEVSSLVKEKKLHQGYDEKFDSYYIDEDLVVDELEPLMIKGGQVVDHHGCDFFPERWFDLVIVLQTGNDTLYPRLEKRGYSTDKITENIECEIMHIVEEEARESYRPEIIFTRTSENIDDMQETVDWVSEWINSMSNHN